MAAQDELAFLTLMEVSELIRTRKLSPVELARAMLARIEAVDPELHSYALTTPELALEQARASEAEIMAGRWRGPMHGVPIGLKDLCFTKGVPTAGGMTIYAGWVPDEDGTVVERLRLAGSVLLGKLQMTEGAFADHHPEVQRPFNPWSKAHWAGASSSGSGVATAAGLCFGSIGSDTGGSIRFPSAMNGVTGLKPTWGRVSRHGSFVLSDSLDHLGPMTRSAADAAAMLGRDRRCRPQGPDHAARAGARLCGGARDRACSARGACGSASMPHSTAQVLTRRQPSSRPRRQR